MAKLRIAGIVPESVVDGPGFRYTVFTQGCRHNCNGCHNPQTHDFNGGYLVDTDDLFSEMMEDPLIKGMTFSGEIPLSSPRLLLSLPKKRTQPARTLLYTPDIHLNSFGKEQSPTRQPTRFFVRQMYSSMAPSYSNS